MECRSRNLNGIQFAEERVSFILAVVVVFFFLVIPPEMHFVFPQLESELIRLRANIWPTIHAARTRFYAMKIDDVSCTNLFFSNRSQFVVVARAKKIELNAMHRVRDLKIYIVECNFCNVFIITIIISVEKCERLSDKYDRSM